MNLDHLLQRADIWRGDQLTATGRTVAIGYSELD